MTSREGVFPEDVAVAAVAAVIQIILTPTATGIFSLLLSYLYLFARRQDDFSNGLPK